MTGAFASAFDGFFADPNIGREAVYTSDGGAPVLVRVVSRQADAITDFGDAQLWSETTPDRPARRRGSGPASRRPHRNRR